MIHKSNAKKEFTLSSVLILFALAKVHTILYSTPRSISTVADYSLSLSTLSTFKVDNEFLTDWEMFFFNHYSLELLIKSPVQLFSFGYIYYT